MSRNRYNKDQCEARCNETKERQKPNGCCSCFKGQPSKKSSNSQNPPKRGGKRADQKIYTVNSERLLYAYPPYPDPPSIHIVSLPYDNYENTEDGRFPVGHSHKYHSKASSEYQKSLQETMPPESYYKDDDSIILRNAVSEASVTMNESLEKLMSENLPVHAAVETTVTPKGEKREINRPLSSENVLRSTKERVSNRQHLDSEDQKILENSILKVSVTMNEALEKVFSKNPSLRKEDSRGTRGSMGTVKMLESMAKVMTENMLTLHHDVPFESASDSSNERRQINWAFLTGSTHRLGPPGKDDSKVLSKRASSDRISTSNERVSPSNIPLPKVDSKVLEKSASSNRISTSNERESNIPLRGSPQSESDLAPTLKATSTADFLDFRAPSCKCDGPNCRACHTKAASEH